MARRRKNPRTAKKERAQAVERTAGKFTRYQVKTRGIGQGATAPYSYPGPTQGADWAAKSARAPGAGGLTMVSAPALGAGGKRSKRKAK